MSDNKFRLAGWLAIASVVILVPSLALGVFYDVTKGSPLVLLIWIMLSFTEMVFSMYAFYQFRNYLNVKHDYFDLNSIIIYLLCLQGIHTAWAVIVRVLSIPNPLAIIIGFSFAIPSVILTIMFGVKLLKQSDMFTLAKPMAYLAIAAAICLATLVGALFGLLIGGVMTVMMGIVLINSGQEKREVEFV